MDPIDAIANGGEPAWSETFTHPKHGEIAFSVTKTPCNKDWIRQANTLDRIVREYGGDPNDASARTTLFANACAGILTLMDRPVIAERRIVDPENEDHQQIETVRYDPLEDEDMGFPMQVWTSYFSWRNDLLDSLPELGKDSGETSGSASDAQSPAVTVSPSTTHV